MPAAEPIYQPKFKNIYDALPVDEKYSANGEDKTILPPDPNKIDGLDAEIKDFS